jgi:hypothetical protein
MIVLLELKKVKMPRGDMSRRSQAEVIKMLIEKVFFFFNSFFCYCERQPQYILFLFPKQGYDQGRPNPLERPRRSSRRTSCTRRASPIRAPTCRAPAGFSRFGRTSDAPIWSIARAGCWRRTCPTTPCRSTRVKSGRGARFARRCSRRCRGSSPPRSTGRLRPSGAAW